jgi:hypothetical protein
MRLYPLGAPRAVIDHPVWGNFAADPDHGGFDLPDELSDEMHSFHHRGKKIWETEDERSERLHGDETARQRDPATLYAAIGELVSLARKAGAADSAPETAKAAPRAATAAK